MLSLENNWYEHKLSIYNFVCPLSLVENWLLKCIPFCSHFGLHWKNCIILPGHIVLLNATVMVVNFCMRGLKKQRKQKLSFYDL